MCDRLRLLLLMALLGCPLAAGRAGVAPAPKAPPEASFPLVSGLERLRGDLKPLSDGRLELYYDGSDPRQLADWRVLEGDAPTFAQGEFQLSGRETQSLRHVASFVGPVEVAGTWRVDKELASDGHCGIGLCCAPWRGYWLHLRDWHQEIYRLDGQPAFLASIEATLPNGADHTFHFARSGSLLRAWLDRAEPVRASDPTYREGAVLVRAWRVRAGLRRLWLLGRPDPQWLALSPSVAAQLDALRLYHAGLDALRPVWEGGQQAEALAKAKSLASDAAYAKAPVAARGLLEDAQAVADLWQAVELGLAKLKPGDPVRVGGADATFQKYERGQLRVSVGGADLTRKLAALKGDELLALAARARKPAAGRDHLALALLRLGSPPDRAAALAELALAQKGGVDVARLRGLLIPRPPTAVELVAAPPTVGARPIFAGKPLFLEAEDAPVRAGALRIERDEAASGGCFVAEPREEGEAQYGSPASRLVFHVLVTQPCSAYLWARVRSPSADANSFFFAIAPEGTESPSLRPWHLAPRPGWHWEPYNAASAVDEGSTTPSPIRLQPGVNAIIIAVRERATALDKLYLSESADPPAQ